MRSEVGNLSWVSVSKNSSQIGHVGSVFVPHPLSIPYCLPYHSGALVVPHP